MKRLRILHVCNIAGVSSIIAKFMDRLFGTESLVVHRKIFDPYGLTTYGEVWDCSARMFALRCLWLARKFDIIHVHSFDRLVPFLKLLYLNKTVIIHYHGSDIRGKWGLRRKYWSKADAIFYSTMDLLDRETPKNAIYIPNPVDTELFHPMQNNNRRRKAALAFNVFLDKRKAQAYAQMYGLSLDILERNIPYRKMPIKLNEYEFYIDKTELRSLSKTGLEALACGLKVIRWDGKLIEKLPEEHRPENVVKKIYCIYRKLHY